MLSEFFHESRGQEHDHKLGNGKGIVDRPVIVDVSQHILCIISGSHRVHNNNKEDQEHTDGHNNPIFILKQGFYCHKRRNTVFFIFCLLNRNCSTFLCAKEAENTCCNHDQTDHNKGFCPCLLVIHIPFPEEIQPGNEESIHGNVCQSLEDHVHISQDALVISVLGHQVIHGVVGHVHGSIENRIYQIV